MRNKRNYIEQLDEEISWLIWKIEEGGHSEERLEFFETKLNRLYREKEEVECGIPQDV